MKRPFSEQFRICNRDGTCQHMTKARHDSMPEIEQQGYADDKRIMSMPADYFGPRGPLFCGASPVVCSSKHCPRRNETNP